MPSTINADNGVSSGSAGLKSTADSSGVLSLQTNGTTAVTVDTSQNVGVGTASPAARLSVDSGSAGLMANFNSSAANGGYLRFQSSGTSIGDIGTAAQTVSGSTSDFSINSRPSGALVFGTSNTERMRIDSSGNVGIGTTSPSTKLHVSAGRTTLSANNEPYALQLNYGSTLNGPYLGSPSADTFVVSTSGGAERMRLDSSGNLLVGTTSNPGTRRFVVSSGSASVVESVYSTTAASNFAIFNACDTSGNNGTGYTMLFRGLGTSGTAEVALSNFIVNSTTVTMYGVYTSTVGATNRVMYVDSGGKIGYLSSTRASKTNIQNVPDASWLYQLKPVSFNYRKKDADGKYTDEADGGIQYGLIAEEVEQVKPDLCFYDEVDGKQELRGIHYEKLVVPMLKAIQELKAEVDSLKSQLAAKG